MSEPKNTKKFSLFNKLRFAQREINSFKARTHQALIENSPKIFLKGFDHYEDYLKGKSTMSELDRDISLIKIASSTIVEFINSKGFKEEKALDYLHVIEEHIQPKIFAFLLWNQNKREACFNILEKHPTDLTSEEYVTLYETLDPQRENIDLPFSSKSLENYLTKQKEEFLFYQEKFNLIDELKSLPQKAETAKKPKI